MKYVQNHEVLPQAKDLTFANSKIKRDLVLASQTADRSVPSSGPYFLWSPEKVFSKSWSHKSLLIILKNYVAPWCHLFHILLKIFWYIHCIMFYEYSNPYFPQQRNNKALHFFQKLVTLFTFPSRHGAFIQGFLEYSSHSSGCSRGGSASEIVS